MNFKNKNLKTEESDNNYQERDIEKDADSHSRQIYKKNNERKRKMNESKTKMPLVSDLSKLIDSYSQTNRELALANSKKKKKDFDLDR